MSLADRTGQVDKVSGMSFTPEGNFIVHRYPRIARLNEQVGSYAIAGSQELLSRLALLRSGVPLYEPGEAPLPNPAVRRLVGGCVNAFLVSVATVNSPEIATNVFHTAYKLHQAVVPH